MIAKNLLIGCGDVAVRLAAQLPPEFYQSFGLRRHPEQLPSSILGLAWDLNRHEGLGEQISGFDTVVITLVPESRDEVGYRQAYVENLKAVIAGLQAGPAPRLVIFVSSSSVYGQDQGEWVDEDTPPLPAGFRGETILEAEQLIRDSGLPCCVVRFSGIYGPGRDFLLRQVREGRRSERDGHYSNRIHADDAAGFLAYLLERQRNDAELDSLYLASDGHPLRLAEVKQWLAAKLGLGETFVAEGPEAGKRCSNRRVLESGFRFAYPSFREGYDQILQEEKKRGQG